MKILTTNVYVGPNLYAHFPVIRQQIDLGVLEQWPTAKLGADYIDAYLKALPGLAEHGCSYGVAGGFVRRLRENEGTWLGHVLEHTVIELQAMAGSDVTFGKTRSIDNQPGCYNMVFEYKQKDVGLAAAKLGRQLLFSLMPAELKAEAFDQYFHYSSTYEIKGDEVFHDVKFSSNPSFPGTMQVRKMNLEGNILTLSVENAGGKQHLQWKRSSVADS